MGYPRGALHVLKGTAFVLPSYTLLCTRVYTVVYPRVHCCIHACTQRRSLLLRLGALLSCTNRLSSALQLAFSRHRPHTLINNVPAYEAGGNLRCDLELWKEMHYLCRRKSKRGCAEQTRRMRERWWRGSKHVCEKNLRRSLVVRKKAVPLQPQNERRVAGEWLRPRRRISDLWDNWYWQTEV